MGLLIPPIIDGDWRSIRQAIAKLASLKLGYDAVPTFTGISLSGLTKGSVLFAGTSGLISQDNSNLFWDATNNRLGIGTNTPTVTLDVNGAIRGSSITDGTATLTGGNLSGSDLDIDAGTGRFVTTGSVVAGVLSADNRLELLDLGTFESTFLRIEALAFAYSATNTLKIDLGNENRTLTFTGNVGVDVTLSDWFDQSVKQSAAPGFASIGAPGDTDLLSFAADALTVNGTIDSGEITQSGTTLDNTYHPLTTVGIAQDNLIKANAGAANNEYAKFTTTGLTGATFQQVSDDLEGTIDHDNLLNFEITEHINWIGGGGATQNFETSGTGEFTGTLGVGIAPDSTQIISASKTFSFAGTTTGIFGGITNTISENGPIVKGLVFNAILAPFNGLVAITASEIGGCEAAVKLQGAMSQAFFPLIATEVFSYKSRIQASKSGTGSVTITNAKGFWATEPAPSGGSTITTSYAFYDEGMTTGATNWGFYGLSGNNYFSGYLAFGQVDKAERIGSDADGTLDLYAGTSIDLHQATTIGDGGVTNYTKFEADGFQTMVGTARVMKSVDLEPSSAGENPGGAAFPADDYIDDFFFHRFDPVSEESVTFHWEVPHDYSPGGTVHMHNEFVIENPQTTGGNLNVRIGVEYKKIPEGAVFDFSADTATLFGDETIVESETPFIIHMDSGVSFNTSGWVAGDVILIRLFREVGAQDTYDWDVTPSSDNDVWMFNHHLEYLCNKIGEAT